MATVRFSGELTGHIIQNAKDLFKQRIEDAKANVPKDIADRVYERGLGRYQERFNALPSVFFRHEDTMKIIKIGDVKCQIECKYSGSKRVFPIGEMPPETMLKFDGYSYMGGLALVNTDGFWDDILAEVTAYQQAIDNLQSQQTSFIDSVKKVIAAHATLAPALKMWPALWDLVPEGTKNKHKEIVERNKSTPTVDVDLGSLTAAVTFSKLTR